MTKIARKFELNYLKKEKKFKECHVVTNQQT